MSLIFCPAQPATGKTPRLEVGRVMSPREFCAASDVSGLQQHTATPSIRRAFPDASVVATLTSPFGA